jgi:hypothetical protein
MTTVQYIAAAAGVAVLAWPHLPAIWTWATTQIPLDSKPESASYKDAIVYLAHVRNRLVATSTLADDQKRAIDVLTLALVDGSDK